jgi:RNA polymerase sigma-70 factor, ECF subfamily
MPDRPTEDGRALVGRLYDTYGASLYRYATLLLADAAARRGAVHQVFTAMLRRPPRLDQEAPTCVARCAECYSMLRRRRADMPPTRAFLEPAEATVNHDERLALERALRSLPAEQREVVHLHVYEGFTFQAIADATDTSINTVASRYRYALDRLRYELDAS